MLDLAFQNLTCDNSFKECFFVNILNVCVKELGLDKKKVEISVNLVGNGKIKFLNKKYRGKDKVTDVLSFPMREDGFKKLRTTNYELRTFDLGDIFISLPFAKKEAKSENVSIDRKLAHLAVHGFLHLAGYDHERSENEADKMFRLEKKILSKVGS